LCSGEFLKHNSLKLLRQNYSRCPLSYLFVTLESFIYSFHIDPLSYLFVTLKFFFPFFIKKNDELASNIG